MTATIFTHDRLSDECGVSVFLAADFEKAPVCAFIISHIYNIKIKQFDPLKHNEFEGNRNGDYTRPEAGRPG
jgi:hypothetical protein